MDELKILQEIGFTESESKVYLALLRMGESSSKGKIIDESKIAPSKIYHILGKLIDKGLVSTITKSNVKYFSASNPSRIKEYIKNKINIIKEKEKQVDEILPKLGKYYNKIKEKTTAEVFLGWKGMETAYDSLLDETKRNKEVYILGASEGENKEKTKRFFEKYSAKAKLKKINIKIIFNEKSRNYVESIEKEINIRLNKKFLTKTTPVEIAITKNVSAIVILKEEPIIVLIRDKETSESFISYFEELWRIAKK